jgi:putative PIN family toxin of toxin-antitoxin system
MTALPHLVLDTNTVLALWHFADPGLAPLARAITSGRCILSSRDDALKELRLVLARPQFGLTPERQAQIVEHYCGTLAKPVSETGKPDTTTFELPQCRDRDDQKFLEIAHDCGASHLLTRDKLLLKLARHRLLRERFRIVTPERFVAEGSKIGFSTEQV